VFAKKNSLLDGAGNWSKRRRIAAFSGQGSGLQAARIADFPVKFPVCREFARRQVRSPLRRQPPSPAFRHGLRPAPHRSGNPGFSRTRVSLQAPGLRSSRLKSRKVSGHIPKNSRFAETIGGDWCDHDCRLTLGSRCRLDLRSRLDGIGRALFAKRCDITYRRARKHGGSG
jgi:hypothetical protein